MKNAFLLTGAILLGASAQGQEVKTLDRPQENSKISYTTSTIPDKVDAIITDRGLSNEWKKNGQDFKKAFLSDSIIFDKENSVRRLMIPVSYTSSGITTYVGASQHIITLPNGQRSKFPVVPSVQVSIPF